MRRDLADFFSTLTEGVKGKRAVTWRLVDAVYPKSQFTEAVDKHAREMAAQAKADRNGPGIALSALNPTVTDSAVIYSAVSLAINHEKRTAELTMQAPTGTQPTTFDAIMKAGDRSGAHLYELDDALLRLG